MTSVWQSQVPSADQFYAHAIAHTPLFVATRVSGLWLVRPRLDTGLILGECPCILEVYRDFHVIDRWHFYQYGSGKIGRPDDLASYDWCPVTAEGIPVALSTSFRSDP